MAAPDGKTLETDLLVIGGGLAGATAALSARALGARVALARRSPGATAVSSGAICVGDDPRSLAGDAFASRQSPAHAARWIAVSRPDHPYAAVGEGLVQLEEALEFVAGELAALLAPLEERNHWLMTPYGSAVPCALCQRSMIAGDLSAVDGTVAVVGFRGHLGFDARLVAAGIERLEGLGAPRAQAVEIDFFMRQADAVSRPHELAQALEEPGAAESAGALLRQVLPEGTAVALFPPVLGMALSSGPSGTAVADRISAAAGVPVAETLSDIPSVPGVRLQRAIEARLAAAGVELLAGGVAPGAGGPGEPVEVAGRTVRAGSWVLATGRFLAGGIARRGRLLEPLLGLPVEISGWPRRSLAPASPAGLVSRPAASLTARDNRAAQPLFCAGLRVDSLSRPLGQDGQPFHPRLHAAGAVLGGHEPAADGTGLGAAILTGWLAGRAAAGKV